MKNTEFKIGQELMFIIFGATVKGTFISENNSDITIKVTEDFSGAIGKERTIRKEFLIR